ncbi:MAG: FtsQ-type POTRA domain-containing protein [Betaproteobacteria bacterium]|nr:FtsQ-type POTRA domain-containing protein [Betaproteobacteria bacterium]
MWDNPRLLNAAANAMIALVATAFVYAGLQALARSSLFPLRDLVVAGSLQHTPRAQIERVTAGFGGNFFAADLSALRARLESLPWVRRVEVRRVWPDRVEIVLEEHVALARWGDTALVNTFGEPFAGQLEDAQAAQLPLFAGPAQTERELARRYQRFAGILQPLGEVPERVILTPRHAWQLRTSGGLHLELGRDGAEPVEARLARFVAAHRSTLGRLPPSGTRHVDLRYPNGFVLRVPEWKG